MNILEEEGTILNAVNEYQVIRRQFKIILEIYIDFHANDLFKVPLLMPQYEQSSNLNVSSSVSFSSNYLYGIFYYLVTSAFK